MEKKRNDNEEMEIDLLELLMVMKKHLSAILLAGIVGLVIMFAYTSFLVTPLYSASSMMYVMPDNSNSMNSSTLSDMQVGQQLTSDYSSMIKSRSFMEDVIKKLNLTIDYQQLLEKVEVTNPTSSRILQVTVNDPNPQTAADIANEMASVAESKLKEITGMQAIKIYEEAAVPDRPSSPSLKKNCALGLLAGIVLAMAVITILYLLDDTIKTEDDIEKYLGMTTLAVLPYNGRKQQRQAQKHKKQRAKQERQTSRKRKEIETDEFN
ncbi:Capsular polysaccharide biosynthesis protein [Coprococcus catus GD/7]|uniref:Capsular polysaccharide biosynthesis protein n=1 Tax=Coprococcus catus GD/7 TaxID=717962 RepID=D4J4T5_9FIRM|nr:Wzz/FepE/Etk N-terminal domain-containing protein [Coprococcus catus]CBK79356.1 Capsular polysaccharide biosynthesis protein [Coprococcus catus GD/7]